MQGDQGSTNPKSAFRRQGSAAPAATELPCDDVQTSSMQPETMSQTPWRSFGPRSASADHADRSDAGSSSPALMSMGLGLTGDHSAADGVSASVKPLLSRFNSRRPSNAASRAASATASEADGPATPKAASGVPSSAVSEADGPAACKPASRAASAAVSAACGPAVPSAVSHPEANSQSHPTGVATPPMGPQRHPGPSSEPSSITLQSVDVTKAARAGYFQASADLADDAAAVESASRGPHAHGWSASACRILRHDAEGSTAASTTSQHACAAISEAGKTSPPDKSHESGTAHHASTSRRYSLELPYHSSGETSPAGLRSAQSISEMAGGSQQPQPPSEAEASSAGNHWAMSGPMLATLQQGNQLADVTQLIPTLELTQLEELSQETFAVAGDQTPAPCTTSRTHSSQLLASCSTSHTENMPTGRTASLGGRRQSHDSALTHDTLVAEPREEHQSADDANHAADGAAHDRSPPTLSSGASGILADAGIGLQDTPALEAHLGPSSSTRPSSASLSMALPRSETSPTGIAETAAASQPFEIMAVSESSPELGPPALDPEARQAHSSGFLDDEICSVGDLKDGGWGYSKAGSEADVTTYLRSSLENAPWHCNGTSALHGPALQHTGMMLQGQATQSAVALLPAEAGLTDASSLSTPPEIAAHTVEAQTPCTTFSQPSHGSPAAEPPMSGVPCVSEAEAQVFALGISSAERLQLQAQAKPAAAPGAPGIADAGLMEPAPQEGLIMQNSSSASHDADIADAARSQSDPMTALPSQPDSRAHKFPLSKLHTATTASTSRVRSASEGQLKSVKRREAGSIRAQFSEAHVTGTTLLPGVLESHATAAGLAASRPASGNTSRLRALHEASMADLNQTPVDEAEAVSASDPAQGSALSEAPDEQNMSGTDHKGDTAGAVSGSDVMQSLDWSEPPHEASMHELRPSQAGKAEQMPAAGLPQEPAPSEGPLGRAARVSTIPADLTKTTDYTGPSPHSQVGS